MGGQGTVMRPQTFQAIAHQVEMLGLVIGGLVVAMYLPIFKLGSVV